MKKNKNPKFAKRHYLTYLFFTSFIAASAYSIYSLRQNNLKMLSLREVVFEEDKSNGDVNKALINLRDYVTSHMNTSLPKTGDQKAVQLKYTYDRLMMAEEERVDKDRLNLGNAAKTACKDVAGQLAKVDCEQTYIQKNPIQEKRTIPKELYSFDFISPSWSFDRAGISIILAGVFLLLWLIDIAISFVVKRSRQY